MGVLLPMVCLIGLVYVGRLLLLVVRLLSGVGRSDALMGLFWLFGVRLLYFYV